MREKADAQSSSGALPGPESKKPFMPRKRLGEERTCGRLESRAAYMPAGRGLPVLPQSTGPEARSKVTVE